MPRFIYTLFLIVVGDLAILLYFFFFVAPKKFILILIFWGALHLFLSLSISLIAFLFFYYKNKKKTNLLNRIFRKFFRRIFILLLIPLGILALKVFEIYVFLNTLLLIIFVLVTYILTELKSRLPYRSSI